MNFHKDSGDSFEPCKHMEAMLNRAADETAPPAMRWYALYHAARCTRCGNFLKRVTALIRQLRDMKSEKQPVAPDDGLSTERWQAIESGWTEVEKSPKV